MSRTEARALAAVGLSRVRERMLRLYGKIVARCSRHGAGGVFDPAQFPWIHDVETQWWTVRRELDEVLRRRTELPDLAGVSPNHAHLAPHGRWKRFFLLAHGVRADENCRRCPHTARIVASIPGVQTAWFSTLAPRTHSPPHRGPFGGVLRYHLAVKVPKPQAGCQIRVGTKVASWVEGRSLVFDDTYEHEACNSTDDDIVVLCADFERPLPPPMRAVNRVVSRLSRADACRAR